MHQQSSLGQRMQDLRMACVKVKELVTDGKAGLNLSL